MKRFSDVIEIEDSDDEPEYKQIRSSNIKSESEPKTKFKPNTQDPKYRKPFRYGWTRELVYRATVGSTSTTKSDVYYKCPTGETLRSFKQISTYLENHTGSGLTIDNFIFVRETLGVDNPQLEVVRRATKRKLKKKKNMQNLEKYRKNIAKKKIVPNNVRSKVVEPISEINQKIANLPEKYRKNIEKKKIVPNNVRSKLVEPISEINQKIANLPDITLLKPSSNKPKPVKCFRGITDPGLRKPFQYGWIREVVFRTSDDDPNRRVDANYITPKGRRVKTTKEISEYLERTGCKDLTTSNFTFVNGPLGLNDPTKEIIIKAYLFQRQPEPVQEVSQPQSAPLQDPKLLKPFEYGWKRELVYRFFDQDRHFADAYYYPPTGEKLRAMTEIAQYLANTRCTTLTVENFTLFRRPLGVNDPQKEIIRSADIKFAISNKFRRTNGQNQQTKPKKKYKKRCRRY